MLCTVATALGAFVVVDAHAQQSGGLPALATDLNNEIARAKAREAGLDAADSQLQANINAAQSSVNNEAAARQAGDAGQAAYTDSRITAEMTARVLADEILGTGLADEATRRQAADANLQLATYAYADTKDAIVLAGAKAYADSRLAANSLAASACFGPHGFRPAGWTCDAGTSDGHTQVCDGSGTCGSCVANSAAIPHFVDNEDGTVTDLTTCLVWEKKNGTYSGGTPCPGATCGNPHDVNNLYASTAPPGILGGQIITQFLDRMNANAFGGHTDWRLPSASELESILLSAYPCNQSPCIDTGTFGPTMAEFYWSSTFALGEGDHMVHFGTGQSIFLPADVLQLWPARAVRGGP